MLCGEIEQIAGVRPVQVTPELPPGARQDLRHTGFSHSDQRAGFGPGEPFNVNEEQDHPLLFRERLDRLTHSLGCGRH